LNREKRFFSEALEFEMRVCVIEAGAAGLCSIKRAVECRCKVTAFEQSTEIGGTWVLREEIVSDVHSSMYKGLRTDIPKEVMGFPDFPYPRNGDDDGDDASYISSMDVLNYLHAYADEFGLISRIQFGHSVVRVRPVVNNGWEVIVKGNDYEIHAFDAVLICTGNFHTPNRPSHRGEEIYSGCQMHSHDYRDPERFRNADICIIGAGPSGIDIVQAIAKTARHVIWSTHLQQQLSIALPDNVKMRPDIAALSPRGAIFVDGSEDKFSILLHCTGYSHSFPFLSPDCGIVVEEIFVSPLYQHCLNVNRPTMAFIGLPTVVCQQPGVRLAGEVLLKVHDATVKAAVEGRHAT
jgi:dimethylaniline monooxygenase (N-oxide forming)